MSFTLKSSLLIVIVEQHSDPSKSDVNSHECFDVEKACFRMKTFRLEQQLTACAHSQSSMHLEQVSLIISE